jgi:uncharacterized protein DUF6790
MQEVIAHALSNFTLTFFVLGLLASAIALWCARPPRTFAVIVEALFAYFLLFSIGVSFLYLHHARVLRGDGGALHRLGG